MQALLPKEPGPRAHCGLECGLRSLTCWPQNNDAQYKIIDGTPYLKEWSTRYRCALRNKPRTLRSESEKIPVDTDTSGINNLPMSYVFRRIQELQIVNQNVSGLSASVILRVKFPISGLSLNNRNTHLQGRSSPFFHVKLWACFEQFAF